MTRFKDFGTGPSERSEPLSFKLHGEEFECLPRMQGNTLLRMVADVSAEDNVKAAAFVGTFFQQVLTDDSYVRFDSLVNSKDKIVTVETLGEIAGWLVEQYTNRPEERPQV